MATQEMQRLWKLSRIDTGLVEVRKRASALDIGARIQAEITELEKQDAEIGANARSLHAEQRDIELRQKTVEDKIAKFNKDLYSGKVTGVREVENVEKEIAALKRQRDRDDERLLELFELVPPAQAAAKKIETALADAKQRLADRRKKAVEEKDLLQKEFTRLTAARPELAKTITPGLLARYDMIRQKTDGIGVVELKGSSCGGCGTNIPERTLQALREDKLATCESCHRLLYYTDGVI